MECGMPKSFAVEMTALGKYNRQEVRTMDSKLCLGPSNVDLCTQFTTTRDRFVIPKVILNEVVSDPCTNFNYRRWRRSREKRRPHKWRRSRA